MHRQVIGLLFLLLSGCGTSCASDVVSARSMIRFSQSDAEIEQACIYDLTVCTVFQGEARFLREWIEYHRLVGVQHFILFNDRSTDNFRQVLRPYIDEGVVELFDCPCPKSSDGTKWTKYQQRVVSTFIQLTRGVSRWVALIDTDEFIVPSDTDSLVEYLSDYEALGQVYIKWVMFGTSYVPRIPDDKLMLEVLTLRGNFNPKIFLGKSIVKPHRVIYPNVHSCGLLPGYTTHHHQPIEFPEIRIFHYAFRDEDFLLNVKVPRRQKWLGDSWDPQERENRLKAYNQVEDLTMFRFVPQLRERIFGDDS